MLLTSKLYITGKKREITSKAMPARKNRLLVPVFFVSLSNNYYPLSQFSRFVSRLHLKRFPRLC